MDINQVLLVLLVAVVMGWFGGGIIWNLRRGNAILKWMQGGLPAIGEKTTLRWLGSSAVEMTIARAKPPFRRFELVLLLEPRDVPWLWIMAYLRGRRDTLILRGQLSSAPHFEYEVIAPESWTGRPALARAIQDRWEEEPFGHHRFVAPRASLPVSIKSAPRILENAQQVHPTVWRLAIRREFPQLELHIPLPNPNTREARQFFEAIRTLGRDTTSA